MKKSFILDYLFGYDVSQAALEKSKSAGGALSLCDKLISGVGKGYAKHIAKNPVMRFFSALSRAFCYTTLRVYGLALLSFGIMTLLLNFGESYFMGLTEIVPFPLIIGTTFTLVSLLLLLSDTPICDLLSKYELTDFIFFELLCLRRVSAPKNVKGGITPPLALLLGALLGALGFIMPLEILIWGLAAVIFSALSFSSPEFCFMLTISALPLLPLTPHPSVILASICTLNLLSFFFKVLLGKRLYHFEVYDLAQFFLFLFILISGIFNKGIESFEGSLVLIALIGSYFLASNLIVNRRIADNAANLLILSSVPTAIYAIIDYFTSDSLHPEWVDGSFANEITRRAEGTFKNPNIYAVFLIVILVFTLVHMLSEKHPMGRLFYFSVFALNFTAFLLTFTRGAWLAFIIAALILILLSSKKAPKLLLIPLLLIPLALAFIPASFINRLLSAFNLSDSSISSRLSIWRSSVKMFSENIFTGVGIGTESFAEEFLKYSEDTVTAVHSHNLFLEIGCEAGIFALILFIYLLIVRLRHLITYSRYIKSTSLTALTFSAAATVLALIAYGMTDYIFYSPTMCYLFFTIFGFCSATLRISKSEHDENVGITGYLVSSDSASLDISLIS